MIKVVSHPLIHVKLTLLRDSKTNPEMFRKCLEDVTLLMFYDIFRHYPTRSVKVKTPLASVANGHELLLEPMFVPVLRAGLGMLPAAQRLFANAPTGFIGLQRNELSSGAKNYFAKLAKVAKDTPVYLLEPMIATGQSSQAALRALFDKGFTNVTLIGLIAAPEGLSVLEKLYPQLAIFVAAIDTKLNAQEYIEPGLGDAGDRMFGLVL